MASLDFGLYILHLFISWIGRYMATVLDQAAVDNVGALFLVN